MSSDFFAKFDGVEGESTERHHEGEIEVLSWSWGASRPSTAGGGGGGAAGKVVPSPFRFVHRYDKASPMLARSCATGEHYRDVRLTARKAGAGRHNYLVVTMQEVIVTSVESSASSEGDVVETVECAYEDIEFAYEAKDDAGGAAGEVVVFGWDVTQDHTRQLARGSERAIEPPLPDAGFESGFYIPFNDVRLRGSGPAEVVANGNLAVSWAGSSFEGSLDENDVPEPAGSRLTLNGAATLELALEAGAEASTSFRLALLALPPFTFGAIQVSPYVQVKLHLAATADGDGRVSIVAPFRIRSGFSFDGEARAGLSSPQRFDPEVGLPDGDISLTASLDLEVVVILLMSINAIPLGGPVLGTSFGVTLGLDPATGADLGGSVEIVGGWAFPSPDPPFLPQTPDDLATLHGPIEFELPDPALPLPVGVGSTRWSRLFDIDGDDGAIGAIAAGDGLIVVEEDQNPWLAALDGFGIPIWQSTAADPWTPTGMAVATNGDLLVAGNSGTSMRLDRFDSLGEPLWTRTMHVPDTGVTTCAAVVQTSSNITILAGKVTRSSVGAAVLTALDASGAVLWSIEVDMGAGATDPEILGLAEAPSGEIIAVGKLEFSESTDPTEPPIRRENALILRVADDGTLGAGFALGGTAEEHGRRVAVHPDGSYVVAGHLGVSPNTWIVSLRADDSLRWSAAYQIRPEDPPNTDFADPTGLATLAANGLLVSGFVRITVLGSPDKDAWLIRLNADGMPVWAKRYFSPDTDDALAGVIALPNGLAAFGRTLASEEDIIDGDLWVVRTNVDGMLHFTDESRLAAENTAVQWQRFDDHTIRPLAPTATALTVDVEPDTELVVDPASAFGELVTE